MAKRLGKEWKQLEESPGKFLFFFFPAHVFLPFLCVLFFNSETNYIRFFIFCHFLIIHHQKHIHNNNNTTTTHR